MTKKKNKGKKEEIAEDWCFVCKDGGLMRVCDYKDCLKAYHPRCVGDNDSFLENDSYWTCASHFCDRCSKTSKFWCLCCPSAVCGNCIHFAEFAIVKGKKGFCRHCSKLAFLIEGNADADSEGGNVDFKDRDTYEGLFSEYYEIIKKEEGLNPQHVHSAHNFLKNVKNKSDLDLDEIAKEEKDIGESEDGTDFEVSDCDDLNDRAGVKSARKKKCTEKLKSAKGKVKDKKKEFTGWGSRRLIEFLKYTGRDTSRELSEYDVASIITTYCIENKLFHPQKKRKIICDQQLRYLLGRKSVNKNSIQNLLAPHFAENFEEMDDVTGSSEDRDDNETFKISTQRKLISSIKSCQNLVSEKTQSTFAAIVSSNLKLVYLKRSLMEELLKQPETFDCKVLGSFVRIKSDPNDYLQKNSYLLLQVKGINRSSKNDENNKEVLLQLSHVPKDVPICKISDDDFTEEECQDLYQRMRNGLLKQPTILELEQKARSLHEDIIKHWIRRELALLQNRIDQANEKGRRRELSEYLDRKLKLENPLEQSRLLSNIPKVIPEIADTNPSVEGSPCKDKLEKNGLPELAIGETCDSDGCYSKHNGFARWLNKRTDVAGLPVQEQQNAEQEKQNVDQDAEQAKDQENNSTTLAAGGTDGQPGAPDSGVADNSEARIDFTPEANILEKGIGSSTVPNSTIIHYRKRKNPSKTEPVKQKKTKAEIEKKKKEMQAHEKVRLWDREFPKTPINFKEVGDLLLSEFDCGQLDSLSAQDIVDLMVKQGLTTSSVAQYLGSVVIPKYEETIMKNAKAAEVNRNCILRLSTKLTDADQERDEMAEKVRTLEEEVVSLKAKCSYAVSAATFATASFEEKKKEVENLQEKINSLMMEKENFCKLLEDEQKKNESAEKSLESKKKEVENLTSLLNAVNQLTSKEGRSTPCPDVNPPD